MGSKEYEFQVLAAKYKAERDIARQEADRMRPAYEWVQKHGGLEVVGARNWFAQQCAARITGEDEGEAEGYELLNDLDKRLMPPGYEWPRFEGGEKVRIGDELMTSDGPVKVEELSLTICDEEGGVTSVPFGERVKRPKPDPIGADGLPIKKGDTVWFTSGNGPYLVAYTVEKDLAHPDLVVLNKHERDWPAHASYLTHTKPEPPDSWERLEKDALLDSCEYFNKNLNHECADCPASCLDSCDAQKGEDLVRRAKALAEREKEER